MTESQVSFACQVAWVSNWQMAFVVKAHMGPWSIQQHAPISAEVAVAVTVPVPVPVAAVAVAVTVLVLVAVAVTVAVNDLVVAVTVVVTVAVAVSGAVVVEVMEVEVDVAHSSSQDDRFRKNSPPSLQHSSNPHNPEHRPSGRQQ